MKNSISKNLEWDHFAIAIKGAWKFSILVHPIILWCKCFCIFQMPPLANHFHQRCFYSLHAYFYVQEFCVRANVPPKYCHFVNISLFDFFFLMPEFEIILSGSSSSLPAAACNYLKISAIISICKRAWLQPSITTQSRDIFGYTNLNIHSVSGVRKMVMGINWLQKAARKQPLTEIWVAH